MKKRFLVFLLAGAMSLSLAACGGKETSAEDTKGDASATESAVDAPEQSVVKWNYGTSGNVLVTIANEKGYFEAEGITIEPVQANANASAMQLLSTGKVDVVSNSGTTTPLQQIASGVDISIFGGHMVEGCMPVVALPDAEWNGIESFIGEKVAVNPTYYAFTGSIMDLGYENPLDPEVVEWVTYSDYNDALAAVIRGEVKYALMGTGQVQSVKEMEENGEIQIVTYQSDVMENYSCCRMVAQTDWIDENPNTVKAICRALIRAQAWYEANKEEAVKLHAAATGTTEEYVAAFMMDEEHYFVSTDPLKDGVVRAWEILDVTGYLGEDNQTDILEHINTNLYEEALLEAAELYGEEVAEFYEAQLAFFEEHNK